MANKLDLNHEGEGAAPFSVHRPALNPESMDSVHGERGDVVAVYSADGQSRVMEKVKERGGKVFHVAPSETAYLMHPVEKHR